MKNGPVSKISTAEVSNVWKPVINIHHSILMSLCRLLLLCFPCHSSNSSTLIPLFNSKTKCVGVRISIFSTNALNISSSNSSSNESLLFIVSRISSNLCFNHPLTRSLYQSPTFSSVLPQVLQCELLCDFGVNS